MVLPGVEEAVLLELPGVKLLEKVPELLPGVFVPAVVFDAVLFTFSAVSSKGIRNSVNL